MVVLFYLIGFPNVKKYVLSLTHNYIAFLTKLVKKKPLLPPKKNITNANKRNFPKRNKKLVTSTNSETDLKNNARRKSKLNPVELPIYAKDDIVVKFQDQKMEKEKELEIVNTEADFSEKEFGLDIDPKKYDKKFFKEYMETSLDDLEFDDAVALDKRTYCEHTKENLIEDQIIANTFIAEDPIKPRSIKIILLSLNFILYFVVNGLFFSEEVISELYEIDEDDENFFSFFPRSIERIIYCTLVSIVIGIIADFFFIDEKKIKGIYRREKDDIVVLKKNISELISDLKKRYLAFIIIVSVILIISFFYLLCFNYVYPYTQIEWIKSSIAIMIIMQILSILRCLLETSLRYLSYKFNSEKLYKISKFLD